MGGGACLNKVGSNQNLSLKQFPEDKFGLSGNQNISTNQTKTLSHWALD